MAAARPRTTACAIRGPIAPPDIGGLGARLQALITATGAQVAVCDLDARVEADLVAVDALARLQLQANRLGCRVRLRAAPPTLGDLLEFLGLAGVVPPSRLRVEPEREAEEGEELRGVEEEGELADSSA
jgi:hypothetical protein